MNRAELIEALKDAEAMHVCGEVQYDCASCNGKACTCGAEETNQAIKAAIEYIETQQGVARIALNPGDVVVIKHPFCMSHQARQNIVENTKAIFPGHQVVVLDAGADIAVIGKEVA